MDVTTALCIVIPSEFHERINKIRMNHDHAFPRWMPHINLLFPFVCEEYFEEVQIKLQKELENFGKFELHLDHVGHFSQKQQVTVNLQAADDSKINQLFELIHDTLSDVEVKRKGFHAHMTLGQWPKNELELVQKQLNTWLQESDPISFQVESIALIKRDGRDDPFEIKKVVHL